MSCAHAMFRAVVECQEGLTEQTMMQCLVREAGQSIPQKCGQMAASASCADLSCAQGSNGSYSGPDSFTKLWAAGGLVCLDTNSTHPTFGTV